LKAGSSHTKQLSRDDVERKVKENRQKGFAKRMGINDKTTQNIT